MIICDKKPYKGFKIYGPYLRKDKRQMVVFKKDGKITSMSYPKFIVETYIGRKLDPNKETIDHIDKNPLNNSMNNLRIIERSQHALEDCIKIECSEQMTCILCGQVVPKERLKWRYRNKARKKKKAGPFCSKHCSGIYGASIQNNYPINIAESKEVKVRAVKVQKDIKKEQLIIIKEV